MHLNGYIDDEAWFGDEITPEALHGMLYPEGEEAHGDLRIFLNLSLIHISEPTRRS